MRTTRLSAVLLACTLSACPPTPAPDGGLDAAVEPDAGWTDAGADPEDAAVDAGGFDAGGLDAGGVDAGFDAGIPTTRLTLRLQTLSGQPLAGALVTDGAASRTTALDGVADFGEVSPGHHLVRAHAPGFVPLSRDVDLPSLVDAHLALTLQVRGPPISFNAATGLDTVNQGVWVHVPRAGVVDATGTPVTGPVQLTISPIDPTTPALASAPLPLRGTVSDGGPQAMLQSVFMADVSLWGSAGQALNLAPDASVTLGFPVPAGLAALYPVGSTVPAWWFDLDAGTWVEEGQGTIVADPTAGDGGARWVASVRHLTSWNSDRTTLPACVKVTVIDQETNLPISDAMIELHGTTSDVALTDATGQACVQLVPGTSAQMRVIKAGYDRYETSVTAPATDSRCSVGGCQQELVRLVVGGCLEGVVQDGTGAPVALATVTGIMTANGESVTYTRTTGTDGRYCLPAPRDQSVELSAIRYQPQNRIEETQTEHVAIGSTQAQCNGRNTCTSAPVLRFKRTCVKGLVKGRSGAPLDGVNVEGAYTDLDGRRHLTATTSDSAGSYCLDVPRVTRVEVTAWRELSSGIIDHSRIETLTTDDTEQVCGAACATVPDLVLQGRTCMKGNVQDSAALPVEDATVEATLDALSDFAVVTADTDALGNYCLEIPASAGYSIIARREVDGLPQHTSEIAGISPSTEAICSGTSCSTLPQLQFTSDATCVSGQVVDTTGEPIPNTAVEVNWEEPGVGHPYTQGKSTDATGTYCATLPINTVTTMLARGRAGVAFPAISSTTSSVVRLGCGGGVCTVAPPLRLPRTTCLTGTIRDATGTPASAGLEALWTGSQYQSLGGSSANGQYCLTVPQGEGLTLRAMTFDAVANDYVTAMVSYTPGPGPRLACGDVGCTNIDLQMRAPGCLHGLVTDPLGAPAPGIEVRARWFGFELPSSNSPNEATTTSGANGEYCLPVHGGPAPVRVWAVTEADGGVDAGWLAAGATVNSTATPLACSADAGACIPVPTLALTEGLTNCFTGRAIFDNAQYLPVDAGTQVYAYSSNPAKSCATSPTTWGDLAGRGVVGADGRFCVEVPIVQQPPVGFGARRTYFNVGGCAYSGNTNLLTGLSGMGRSPATCGGPWCTDLGDYNVRTR